MDPARAPRLDRQFLTSALVSGGFWSAVLVGISASWPLVTMGAMYVIVAGGFMAWAGPGRVAVWVLSWFGAVALWTAVLLGVESGPVDVLWTVLPATVIGTGCFVGWQVLALAVRQALAWRETFRAPAT